MILLNDLRCVIEDQLQRYPKMQPQDAAKLVYQHVFGAEEKNVNKEQSLDFIRKEYEAGRYSHTVEDLSKLPLYEHIGNRYARVNLLAAGDAGELEIINEMYAATSKMSEGDTRLYISRLYLLIELARNGNFSFGESEMNEFLKTYEKAGYPKLTHSGIYKELYEPAYRVIDARFIRLRPLISRINELLRRKDKIVIAFDGKRGSGKSTAAALISLIYDTTVISMDDFALPAELSSRERLAEPGGNIHYERFLEEVAIHIKKDEKFTYSRYDIGVMNYTAQVEAEPRRVMIVDGTYSQHIEYRSIYDIKVFFDADDATMQANIINTRGEQYYYALQNSWLLMDKMYFEHSEIKQKSDFVIE